MNEDSKQNSYSLNKSERNSYLQSNHSQLSDSDNFHKYENQEEHGLVERIYDEGQGEKFNDLIKTQLRLKQ